MKKIPKIVHSLVTMIWEQTRFLPNVGVLNRGRGNCNRLIFQCFVVYLFFPFCLRCCRKRRRRRPLRLRCGNANGTVFSPGNHTRRLRCSDALHLPCRSEFVWKTATNSVLERFVWCIFLTTRIFISFVGGRRPRQDLSRIVNNFCTVFFDRAHNVCVYNSYA